MAKEIIFETASHIREPLAVHTLPAAPVFIGRQRELAAIAEFWSSGDGVLSLVGVGGSGKTALISEFLRRTDEDFHPDGLLIWSFYDDPDANAFLQTAYSYFAASAEATAHGAGWFHLLKEALATKQRNLIVLDGLERVQRPQTDASGIYGELEDPLLKGLLRRLVTGTGRTKAIITSRFPVADLERWTGKGYGVVDVDHMAPDAATFLLRTRGVEGEPETIHALLERFGRHALTLDLLASAATEFHSGTAESVLKNSPDIGGDSQESRLATVLGMHQKHLGQRGVDLLSRLCVFRFGVSSESLAAIFFAKGSESIAGSLAGLSQKDLDKELERLLTLHLVYREASGTFTVHPAVRDHFYRMFREPEAVHLAISKHLLSLTDRPGIGLPTEKSSLDLLEELVYHALRAGRTDDAAHIYFDRLGGNDHLNVRLGEYARTYRMLAAFEECPDPGAMYHCLRSFGRFEEALQWRPQNRYIRLVMGDLPTLAADTSERTRRYAKFLMGADKMIPDRAPDFPIPPAMLHLLKGSAQDAEHCAKAEVAKSLFADDLVRNRLVLGEAERRLGRRQDAAATLRQASEWVLFSGSSEHLCLLHLFRASLALDEGNTEGAAAAIDEGMQIAEDSHFRLLQVELLLERSRALLARANPDDARGSAEAALALARDPALRFAWGEAKALVAIGESLLAGSETNEGISNFRAAATLLRKLDSPEADPLERRIRQLEHEAAHSARSVQSPESGNAI